MLTKPEISQWAEHPITLKYLELVNIHKSQLESDLREYMLNCQTTKDMDVGQFRGQINALEKLLDLKETLFNLSEEYDKPEVDNDKIKVPSPRS